MIKFGVMLTGVSEASVCISLEFVSDTDKFKKISTNLLTWLIYLLG